MSLESAFSKFMSTALISARNARRLQPRDDACTQQGFVGIPEVSLEVPNIMRMKRLKGQAHTTASVRNICFGNAKIKKLNLRPFSLTVSRYNLLSIVLDNGCASLSRADLYFAFSSHCGAHLLKSVSYCKGIPFSQGR